MTDIVKTDNIKDNQRYIRSLANPEFSKIRDRVNSLYTNYRATLVKLERNEKGNFVYYFEFPDGSGLLVSSSTVNDSVFYSYTLVPD